MAILYPRILLVKKEGPKTAQYKVHYFILQMYDAFLSTSDNGKKIFHFSDIIIFIPLLYHTSASAIPHLHLKYRSTPH